MEYKPFLYAGLICMIYAMYLKKEKEDWKYTRSIVSSVKVNDTVLTQVGGLEISEIESNADVLYKINDELYENNISVTRNQPLQLGNVIPIKYNENYMKRQDKQIPDAKYFQNFGIMLLCIAGYLAFLQR